MLVAKTPLPDLQSTADLRGVGLDNVGVSAIEVPFQLRQKDGASQPVVATVKMSVGLSPEVKGAHLSRFVIQLAEWSKTKVIGLDFRSFLFETMTRLSAPTAQVSVDFKYFIDRIAPISKMSSPMGYQCSFAAALEKGEKQASYKSSLGVRVPISTLCPCSKAISEYGAHNQRAVIHAQVNLRNEGDQPVWIEDLITALEECSSCPVYPILKREDEKYVTEKQYENPMFVEDVCREATLLLRNYPGVSGFLTEVEALESIHGHNAWTSHRENFESIF